LQENKDFIELSIETSVCVNKALQILAFNSLLQDQDYKVYFILFYLEINLNKQEMLIKEAK
jgi:hypothetical protein